MPRHRSHSIDFKREVVAEYHAGETLHALGRRHDDNAKAESFMKTLKVEAGYLAEFDT
jgi:transposase-like protein